MDTLNKKVGIAILGATIASSLFLISYQVIKYSKADTKKVGQDSPKQSSTTPTPTPVPTPLGKLELIFGGDVMLGRKVEQNIREKGVAWPFAKIGKTMQGADLTVVNLESPFREDAISTISGSLVLRGYPEGIKTLNSGGVDVVSLSNNHITDMRLEGLHLSLIHI